MSDLHENPTDSPTIETAINKYLESVKLSRSDNTARTYSNAMVSFRATLADRGLPAPKTDIAYFKEVAISWFAEDLKYFSPSTERLYLSAVTGFFEFLVAEEMVVLNLPRVRLLIRQRARRPGQRLPQFPRDYIELLLDYAINLASIPADDPNESLRNLRDKAFLLTLADTGLRVHEACALRRGDIDWNEGKAVIIGKGDRQAVVRFSSRSLKALRAYLSGRAKLDGASGRPLPSLPVFARHDKGAGKKVKPITTATGRNIVSQRVTECLGKDAVGSITPHSFRHYFVTAVLQGSGNLKLAQELARHRNIAVTQRYAHLSDDELDKGYLEIFDE
ncbi:MAG: tyrosine-type recombinase/integrase [Anaerolineales bacterium]|nr:tyrosine-type recombinase/integrase [Anaerolineales bacterium]